MHWSTKGEHFLSFLRLFDLPLPLAGDSAWLLGPVGFTGVLLSELLGRQVAQGARRPLPVEGRDVVVAADVEIDEHLGLGLPRVESYFRDEPAVVVARGRVCGTNLKFFFICTGYIESIASE